ncbi:MAG: GIY-YIG nuclease family protein [Chitinophagaceae bacterium]|nr:GIY-YIG nuclease family protein [Chitinophagaceae bacterium]
MVITGGFLVLCHYVYIRQSQKDNSFYKGFSENPYQRLHQHNNGESPYTSSKVPWVLACLLEFDSKTEALIKERKLKKYSNASLNALIRSSQNKLL